MIINEAEIPYKANISHKFVPRIFDYLFEFAIKLEFVFVFILSCLLSWFACLSLCLLLMLDFWGFFLVCFCVCSVLCVCLPMNWIYTSVERWQKGQHPTHCMSMVFSCLFFFSLFFWRGACILKVFLSPYHFEYHVDIRSHIF